MSPEAQAKHPRLEMQALAPQVYRAMAGFDRSIELDPQLRELVKIRASQINGCAYCIELHTRDARSAGESERRIYALAAWHESPLFSQRERAALELTDALTRVADGGLDAAYANAARELEEAELAQLILAITAINAWNRIAISSGMVYTEPAE
ncbi:MAG TPA: carboxymuconolactone decarboxylase family protein [Solirubrobacteraceae bacterium]|jgi:AhpD family alkylhydroperoxidase